MSTRSLRHLRGAVAAAALATAALASFGFASSAGASVAAPGSTATGDSAAPKPTVVLVHGAFADASGFDAVIDRLRRDGYPVEAAPDPLVGLQYDAATVRAFIDSIKGPKILVGHSYGGAVITQAASGDPAVKALVYLAALAPDSGEALGDLLNTPVADPVAPLPLVSVNVPQPDGTTRADLYLDPSQFRARFAADLPAGVAADMAATQQPLSAAAFTDRLTVEPAWKTIPSWYLVSKEDNAMSPDLERFQADRMHAHTVQIDSSHAVYMSHPGAVANLIEQAAQATS